MVIYNLWSLEKKLSLIGLSSKRTMIKEAEDVNFNEHVGVDSIHGNNLMSARQKSIAQ